MITIEQLESLPLYIDGSDGSLWQSRNDLATVRSEPDSAVRHYIRVSDLLLLLGDCDAPIAPTGECTVPPPGWVCSREPGHSGPCAARPIVGETPNDESVVPAADFDCEPPPV